MFRRRRGGIISGMVFLFVLCVLFVIALKLGGGNIMDGMEKLWDAWWYWVNQVANRVTDRLL